jgi:hypothetical protein
MRFIGLGVCEDFENQKGPTATNVWEAIMYTVRR